MPLTNTQYDTIMREYYDIRAKNKYISDQRQKEIVSLSPEYGKISEQIGELSVGEALARLSDGHLTASGSAEDIISEDEASPASGDIDNKNTSDSFRSRLYALKKKQEEILVSLGKPANYLEPVYTCNICKDTGYVGTKKCSCFKKRELELLYKDSNLKNMTGFYTFDDFDLSLYSETEIDERTGRTAREYAEIALEAAKDLVNNFDKTGGNLFIYGQTGLGKTFLSTCIASALINTTHSVVYVTATELFNKLNTFDEEVESSPIIDCDLLIIDDLGTEYRSEVSLSKLFYCLNERMLRRKSCVISTNLDPVAIRDNYSERIFSRIVSGYKIIKLFGKDIRTAKIFG